MHDLIERDSDPLLVLEAMVTPATDRPVDVDWIRFQGYPPLAPCAVDDGFISRCPEPQLARAPLPGQAPYSDRPEKRRRIRSFTPPGGFVLATGEKLAKHRHVHDQLTDSPSESTTAVVCKVDPPARDMSSTTLEAQPSDAIVSVSPSAAQAEPECEPSFCCSSRTSSQADTTSLSSDDSSTFELDEAVGECVSKCFGVSVHDYSEHPLVTRLRDSLAAARSLPPVKYEAKPGVLDPESSLALYMRALIAAKTSPVRHALMAVWLEDKQLRNMQRRSMSMSMSMNEQ
ncbi:hypothetical protein P43SY_007884 [Pythium insidiosum]|uniref:Uncharacterized protein n=1 Tax=Pythium insidiosum TaxID=114742 RepID=A0AAD5M356_PYTIN|nr:hypothetical protein P43SY_007884 [Pythium insidiosum]